MHDHLVRASTRPLRCSPGSRPRGVFILALSLSVGSLELGPACPICLVPLRRNSRICLGCGERLRVAWHGRALLGWFTRSLASISPVSSSMSLEGLLDLQCLLLELGSGPTPFLGGIATASSPHRPRTSACRSGPCASQISSTSGRAADLARCWLAMKSAMVVKWGGIGRQRHEHHVVLAALGNLPTAGTPSRVGNRMIFSRMAGS